MKDDFSKELLLIIDESFKLLKTELTTLRTELMVQKIEHEKIKFAIQDLKDDQTKRLKNFTAIWVAIIAAIGSLIVTLVKIKG